MKPVDLIGLGLSPQDLTACHLQRIGAADVLAAGRRILAWFPDFKGETLPVAGDLEPLIQRIRQYAEEGRSVAVVASGDPLFYGIGPRLIAALGEENLRIYPNISSVSAAFARIKRPWQDAKVISLHGPRGETSDSDADRLCAAVRDHGKVAVLTDAARNPAWISERVCDMEIPGISICVLERLGTEEERIRWFAPEDVSGRSFAAPNIVILLQDDPSSVSGKSDPMPHLGMAEEAFSRRRGLITKAEVRAVSLSKLCLDAPDYVLWDLGAGSGSVSVEAALFLPKGNIYAVERDLERIADIQRNRSRYAVHQLVPIHAELPQALDDLPAPDRVFVGGGGKDLSRIIEAAAQRLKRGGVMVANTVLLQSADRAIGAMKEAGLATETIQVQINRSRSMPGGERFDALNPVWIVQGRKNKEMKDDTP